MTGQSVMVNSDTSARTHGNTVKHLGAIRRLTVDDIRVAISDREKDLDDRQHGANIGVVILLIVNVIALVTLYFHVATK